MAIGVHPGVDQSEYHELTLSRFPNGSAFDDIVKIKNQSTVTHLALSYGLIDQPQSVSSGGGPMKDPPVMGQYLHRNYVDSGEASSVDHTRCNTDPQPQSNGGAKGPKMVNCLCGWSGLTTSRYHHVRTDPHRIWLHLDQRTKDLDKMGIPTAHHSLYNITCYKCDKCVSIEQFEEHVSSHKTSRETRAITKSFFRNNLCICNEKIKNANIYQDRSKHLRNYNHLLRLYIVSKRKLRVNDTDVPDKQFWGLPCPLCRKPIGVKHIQSHLHNTDNDWNSVLMSIPVEYLRRWSTPANTTNNIPIAVSSASSEDSSAIQLSYPNQNNLVQSPSPLFTELQLRRAMMPFDSSAVSWSTMTSDTFIGSSESTSEDIHISDLETIGETDNIDLLLLGPPPYTLKRKLSNGDKPNVEQNLNLGDFQ